MNVRTSGASSERSLAKPLIPIVILNSNSAILNTVFVG